MVDSDTNKKIEELSLLEAHLQSMLAQKQSFQVELNEITNALDELEKMPKNDEIYKVSYGIMLRSSKDKVIKELEEKKKLVDARISSVDRQQTLIEKNIQQTREEINGILSHKKK